MRALASLAVFVTSIVWGALAMLALGCALNAVEEYVADLGAKEFAGWTLLALGFCVAAASVWFSWGRAVDSLEEES